MSWLLDISIGPVQTFVGESRRTRDLWGSSYLLSVLAANAAVGAEQAGGRVHVVESPLLRAVREREGGAEPWIGTVPNHFLVTIPDAGNPEGVATVAEQRLQEAWRRVCDAVRRRFVDPVASAGAGTRDVWDRQTRDFWQVTWVIGGADVRALRHRRGYWRSHCPPDEPGDKCSVMPAFQELSGHIRPRGSSAQAAFWRKLRSQPGVGPLDLRVNERLCAIALVKRLLPKVAEQALGWRVDVAHWPSTLAVGADPWLRAVQDVAAEPAARYAQQVLGWEPAARRPLAALASAGPLAELDANYLHRGFVADRQRCPLSAAVEKGQEAPARAGLSESLGRLYQTGAGTAGSPAPVGAPPVYYAVLRADGDELGKLAADQAGRDLVGWALADFTDPDGVEEIIRRHHGVTVYAGGDDVLAMLPVPGALACAADLARRYRRAFARRDQRVDAHLSAGVLFAHVRLPLATALADSKRLLEEVAKEGNERDSLAIGVLKPGSRHCEWVTHWERLAPDGQLTDAVGQLGELVRQLSAGDADPGLSSSVIYRARDALGMLCGWPRWEPGSLGVLPPGVDSEAFLRAEMWQSLATHLRLADLDDPDPEGALRDRVDALAGSVLPLLRHDSGAAGQRISLDPLLLARFLVHGGQEEHA